MEMRGIQINGAYNELYSVSCSHRGSWSKRAS